MKTDPPIGTFAVVPIGVFVTSLALGTWAWVLWIMGVLAVIAVGVETVRMKVTR
ncbi:hypothetical protein SAMN04487905_101368 [Actinopolyspora xinjiangensis]|uniref:Uncharacterized protein n=1 Tax=Actinopolyspora xinjiangensis TaxID=405564 RepID=A0A1H0P2Y1_9ACTN|nr:hypothetical protein [Actinopolyspora xinjiangensis]SDO99372.1 hypothetical protein SAMN04487905_101368 [Actinopolyspora xinjiangensis]